MVTMATWFITGCSTGFGRALAEAVLADGHRAVITARNPDQLSDLVKQYRDDALALPLDVTDRQQIDSAASRVLVMYCIWFISSFIVLVLRSTPADRPANQKRRLCGHA